VRSEKFDDTRQANRRGKALLNRDDRSGGWKIKPRKKWKSGGGSAKSTNV